MLMSKVFAFKSTDFTLSIRILLDNKFVSQLFWDYQNGKLTELEWKEKFSTSNSVANNA